jgi:hypothetical protein
MRRHVPALENLRRLLETGDGPLIYPVDAASIDLYDIDMDGRAQVAAILLDARWPDKYLNTRAAVLGERYRARRMTIAFLGVPRKRLAKHVLAMASWVVAEP